MLYWLFAIEAREIISCFGVILRCVWLRGFRWCSLEGVCGVASYLGLLVAVRNQGESRLLCIRVSCVVHRYVQGRSSPDHG